ncbi:MAG: PepSY domain-containing protein [Paracoccaceae bacterium]
MKPTVKLAAAILTATMALAPVAQAESGESGAAMSASQRDAVTTKLSKMGYEVRNVVMEDGTIEVYAMKDGKRHVLYLNSNLDIVNANGS